MTMNCKGLSLSAALLLAAALVDAAATAAQTSAATRGVQDVTSAATQLGPYYALVIGNNDYRYLPKLQTAINDGDAMAQLLQDQYGFVSGAA